MKAIIKLDVPDYQIGQEVNIYFKDTMMVKGVVEKNEGRWIPVSERPEILSYVYCTCHSLIDDREDWVIDTVYIPQLSDSPYSDWGNIPMLNWGQAEVVAWMYRDIPKPYKAESEDKK